jgi:hypothetical protein
MARKTIRIPDSDLKLLQDFAGRTGRTLSEAIRYLAREGLAKYAEPEPETMSKDTLQEVLLTLFGVEEIIVRTFDPKVGVGVDLGQKRELLSKIGMNARKRTGEQLEP